MFNIENGDLTPDSITPTEYAKFLEEIQSLYLEYKLYKKFPIEPLLSMMQKINKKNSNYCVFSDKKCYNFISIYANNMIGPCDCFDLKDFKILNIDEKTMEEIISFSLANPTENQRKIISLLTHCKRCEIVDFCTGGCLSQRYYMSENKVLLDDYCNSRHHLYRISKTFMVN